jgi:class 3 adenylate cyclase
MKQQIRFCTTSSGARIACATIGDGPALVCVPGWVSHLELQWEKPSVRSFYERLARHHTVVLYDKHGTGLSDRNRKDFSLEAELRDLETVIDQLRLKRLTLLGGSQGGPIGVAYAVKHPRCVTHLILYGTYACGDAIAKDEFRESILSLIRAHWGVGSKTIADLFLPGTDAITARWFARFQRESATAEMAAQLLVLVFQIDVTDLLPRLRVPTLVIHRQRDRMIPFQLGRDLAALIPNALFVPLEGNIHLPWFGDADSLLRAMAEFLGDPVTEAVGQAPLTILFTDIEGSTMLTQRLGDAKAQELIRNHNTIVRDALKAHSGSEIKHTGDGIMASFPSASLGIECAIAIQKTLAEYNEKNPDTPLRVRIGLNAGEPVAEDADLFGTAVQLTARICAHADPGQILASEVVRQLVAGKGFLFADQGETALRGFEEPVRLYEVRWREEGS